MVVQSVQVIDQLIYHWKLGKFTAFDDASCLKTTELIGYLGVTRSTQKYIWFAMSMHKILQVKDFVRLGIGKHGMCQFLLKSYFIPIIIVFG